MNISEDDMPTWIGGIKGNVVDYSISVVGPGEKSMKSWEHARKRGLDTAAKVQFNNSWECSAVPYLPVMDLVEQHLRRLIDTGVNGLMLGWTLGGFPSLTLELASQYYWEQEGPGFRNSLDLAGCVFGDKAGIKIKEVWGIFSEAFKEFPFHIDVLYTAPDVKEINRLNKCPVEADLKMETDYLILRSGLKSMELKVLISSK